MQMQDLTNDGMEPGQWADMFRTTRQEPELKLMQAVLVNALENLGSPKHGNDARLWLFDDSRKLFSFESICDYLHLDPDAVRSAAKAGKIRKGLSKHRMIEAVRGPLNRPIHIHVRRGRLCDAWKDSSNGPEKISGQENTDD
jgi:hypothetical protein